MKADRKGGHVNTNNQIAKGRSKVQKGDLIIYACTIIGAGIGLLLGNALPGVVIGVGAGYLFKIIFKKED